MKNKVRKIVVAAMMVIVSTMGFASGKWPTVKMYKAGTKSVAIFINATIATQTQVRLIDEAGIVLHNESYKRNEGFSKKFELSALPQGRYFFEVENERSYGVFPLTIAAEKITLRREETVMLVKPIIHQDGDVMDLLVSSDKNVKVEIHNEHRQLVFSETLNSEKGLRRRYYLSSLTKGNYRVSVNVNKKGFTKLLALK